MSTILELIEVTNRVAAIVNGLQAGRKVWVYDPQNVEGGVFEAEFEDVHIYAKGFNNCITVHRDGVRTRTAVNVPVGCVFLTMDEAYQTLISRQLKANQKVVDELNAAWVKARAEQKAEKEKAA